MATDLWSGFYGAIGGFLSAPVVMLYQVELQDLKAQIVDLEKLLEDIDVAATLLLSAVNGDSGQRESETVVMISHRRMHTKLSTLEERGMPHTRVESARRNLDALWEFVTDDDFVSDDRDVVNVRRARLNDLTPKVLKTVRPNAADPVVMIKQRIISAVRRGCSWPDTSARN